MRFKFYLPSEILYVTMIVCFAGQEFKSLFNNFKQNVRIFLKTANLLLIP